jgi:hypothetical protein
MEGNTPARLSCKILVTRAISIPKQLGGDARLLCRDQLKGGEVMLGFISLRAELLKSATTCGAP